MSLDTMAMPAKLICDGGALIVTPQRDSCKPSVKLPLETPQKVSNVCQNLNLIQHTQRIQLRKEIGSGKCVVRVLPPTFSSNHNAAKPAAKTFLANTTKKDSVSDLKSLSMKELVQSHVKSAFKRHPLSHREIVHGWW